MTKSAEELGLVFSRSQPLVEFALKYATKAHEGQERKYTGEPYITHPIEVAQRVYDVRPDVSMVCAALLHDVIEDCGLTKEDLNQAGFGWPISSLVVWLTDVSQPADGNRAARKAIDRGFISKAPPNAQTIKLADLISNSDSIMQYDPDFAKVYMNEKRLLLDVLKDGDATLLTHARDIVSDYFTLNPAG